MCEFLTPILKGISYDPVESKHNIWGIISPTNKYFAGHNTLFTVPARRSLFDTTIAKASTNTVLHQAEAEHTARRNNRALYKAVSSGVVNFFRTIVDETCYQYLKDTDA